MNDEKTEHIDAPEVASYQKAASLGGWAGGGRTLWAIGVLGAAAGAAMGAVAPLFPALVTGALPALSVIGASAVTFASIGMMMGFSGGLVLGRISGASAAVGEEQERRMKSWTAKMLKQVDPHVQMIDDKEVEISPGSPLNQQLKESYYTYVNPRIGMTMSVVGAAGGAILAGAYLATGGAIGPIVQGMGGLIGIDGVAEAITSNGAKSAVIAGTDVAVNAPAVIMAYTTGIAASFGALFSFNFPKLTSELTDFSGRLVGGKIIGREWGPPGHTKEAELARASDILNAKTPVQPNIAEAPGVSFAEKLGKDRANDYQEMLLKQQQESQSEIHIG